MRTSATRSQGNAPVDALLDTCSRAMVSAQGNVSEGFGDRAAVRFVTAKAGAATTWMVGVNWRVFRDLQVTHVKNHVILRIGALTAQTSATVPMLATS